MPQSSRIVVAYSGGLDSSVLLHALSQIVSNLDLRLSAVHVHHGLSHNADKWAEHCKKQCAQLGIPLEVVRVKLTATSGIEQAAREARYQAFESVLRANDVLMMAHHRDDQNETVLMRMLRGSDTALYSGIPHMRQLREATLIRPLLDCPRSQLEQYAALHRLSWIEDESNQDVRIERNRIRHQVLPALRASEPSIDNQLNAIAQGHQYCNASMTRAFRVLFPALVHKVFAGDEGLSLTVLGKLSLEVQHRLVRLWLQSLQCQQPGAAIFERIWSELIPAKKDAVPQIDWDDRSIRRYDDALFVVSRADVSQTLPLPNVGVTCRPWSELSKTFKVQGTTKREIQRTMRIPPWRRHHLAYVAYNDGREDVLDMLSGSSVWELS